ncbi:MAG: DJ-1/PfpI family protein, partial [Candidatus Hadarchaeales archaeon]
SSIYFSNKHALSIAKEAFSAGKVVGAICIAPVILANAGILKGRRATVWDGDFVKMLEAGGAKYTGKNVEVDGKIVTANGPHAAREFGKKIAELLR